MQGKTKMISVNVVIYSHNFNVKPESLAESLQLFCDVYNFPLLVFDHPNRFLTFSKKCLEVCGIQGHDENSTEKKSHGSEFIHCDLETCAQCGVMGRWSTGCAKKIHTLSNKNPQF